MFINRKKITLKRTLVFVIIIFSNKLNCNLDIEYTKSNSNQNLGKNFYEKKDLIFSKEYCKEFQEVEKFSADCSDAVVKLIKNKDGKKFILKQIVDPDLDEQFLLVRDLVASEIGIICGIPVNKIIFSPAVAADDLNTWEVKFYPDRAATIHSFVSGKSLDEEFPGFLTKDFMLQQKFSNPDSPWQKELPVKVNEQGLTKHIIESMAFHEDLSRLVAFDTFVGNSDRSFPNIFYDKSEDKFYGIDHAAAFNCKNLPFLAIERLKELELESFFKNCSNCVINGLRLYHKTLVSLYEEISLEFVEEALLKYSQHICKKDDGECQKFLMKRAKYQIKAFEENYRFTKELIDLLDEIIFLNSKEKTPPKT